MNGEPMTIGEKLRAARKAKGLTQEQVAQKLHICREAYALNEGGKNEITVKRLMTLARILGVSAASLLPDDYE